MKFITSILIAGSLLTSVSCSSLNNSQKRELSDWDSKGLKVEENNEALAAGLNVLPGIGDFYNGNIGLGVVNLLTWPLSILWAPVGGATGAAENNYYSSKTYVEKLENQKQVVANDLQAAAMTKQITNDEYFIALQRLKTMNLIDFNKAYSVMDFVPRLSEVRQPSSSFKK